MTPSPPSGPSGRPARERILCYGDTGSGKTTALLSLAEFFNKRGSDTRFYVVSSGDLAYEQMVDERHPNIEWIDCYEYPDWLEAGRKFRAEARSEDWLVVDLYSSLWQVVQNHFIDTQTPGEPEDFWTVAGRRAQDSTSGWSLYEDFNWQLCNRWYNLFSSRAMGRWPGHVLAMAAEKPVEKDRGGKVTEANADIAEWFGRLGVKPAGQKDMPYEFRDILLCKRLGSGKFTLTTAKARKRAKVLRGQEWDENFFQRFLLPVCGWTP